MSAKILWVTIDGEAVEDTYLEDFSERYFDAIQNTDSEEIEKALVREFACGVEKLEWAVTNEEANREFASGVLKAPEGWFARDDSWHEEHYPYCLSADEAVDLYWEDGDPWADVLAQGVEKVGSCIRAYKKDAGGNVIYDTLVEETRWLYAEGVEKLEAEARWLEEQGVQKA